MTLSTTISPARKAQININGSIACFAEFQNKSVKEVVSNFDQAICNDIDHPIWRRAEGREILACTVKFDFTGAQLDELLPLLGMTSEYGTYYHGDNDELTEFPFVFDLVGSIHEWSNCVCARYAWRGSRGGRPMQFEMDIVGTSEVEGTEFTADPVDADRIFSFTNLSGFSIRGTERLVNSFLVQVDNKLVLEWNNSKNLTSAVIGARETVIATSVPYIPAWDDLYWTLKTDFDGIETLIEAENDDTNLTFAAPACVGISRTGEAVSKNDQIRTPVTLLCDRNIDGYGARVSPLTIVASSL